MEERPWKKNVIVVNDINKDEDYLFTFSDTKSEIVVPVFAADTMRSSRHYRCGKRSQKCIQ